MLSTNPFGTSRDYDDVVAENICSIVEVPANQLLGPDDCLRLYSVFIPLPSVSHPGGIFIKLPDAKGKSDPLAREDYIALEHEFMHLAEAIRAACRSGASWLHLTKPAEGEPPKAPPPLAF